ncbi:hypothetical protein CPLU01_10774 [Colletotrichum plurivorum]|uniref:Uncharacterized protein n=1 Tax=Colletotrichum plurivorum TaxID=2175906 RepID=A0A8H6K5E6_9PEZI|nr:hypothetical protein CPLU01_10774 [Colletotrichum plurivorum]
MANEHFGLDKHGKKFRSRLWPWIITSARCASAVTCPIAEWRGENPRQEFMCNGGEVLRPQPGWMDGWDNKASSAGGRARDDNGGDVRGDRDGNAGSLPDPKALIACCLRQDDGTKGSRCSYSLVVLFPRPRLSDTENAAAVSTGSEAATPWCPMPSRLGHLIDNLYEGRSHSLLTGWENLDPFTGRNPKRARRPGSKSTIISAVAAPNCVSSAVAVETQQPICVVQGGPNRQIHEPAGDGPSADVSRRRRVSPSVTARRSLNGDWSRLFAVSEDEDEEQRTQRRAQKHWTKRSLCRVVGVSLRQPESSRGAM